MTGYLSTGTLDELVEALDATLKQSAERYLRGVAEEAGEVMGAYNKMVDGREDKPKDTEDILQEMAQLITCCLLAARKFDYGTYKVMTAVSEFVTDKARENGHR